MRYCFLFPRAYLLLSVGWWLERLTGCSRILVRGLVQGVGFRPFVYRLAVSLGARGFVRNISGSSVEIWVEGIDAGLFVEELHRKKPWAAIINNVDVESVECRGYSSFFIEKSAETYHGPSMIPPDIAICDDCLREIEDPRDRRYRYPFNSCVKCGPRYSMMYSPLYDRENTSMRDFPLCSNCLSEYGDPANERRFHAQGISCPVCGPRLWLTDEKGEALDTEDPIRTAAQLVREGYIVAVKGIGGFHIAADPFSDDVVLRLRERKRRPRKPFAVMAFNIEWANRLGVIDSEARELLLSPQRPIVLVPKRSGAMSEHVAPGLRHVGLFLPYSGIHYLLLKELGASIMTSGNPHGEAMVTSNHEALAKLRGIADYFLLHNREIVNRVDDSVLRRTLDTYTFLRRGRGYAPMWLELRFKLRRKAVAVGADLQSAGAVGFDDKVILTQFIGDVDEPSNYSDLIKYIEFLASNYKLDIGEAVIVADRHPRYISRVAAQKLSEKHGSVIAEVQHHHAHLASVLAEIEGEDASAVGIAIDGIGYGDNGEIWGGEVMEFSFTRYRRTGSLWPIKLTGGDRDVVYPARVAYSLMLDCMGDEALGKALLIGLDKALPGGMLELEVINRMRRAGRYIHASSMGRALDAASVVLGFSATRTYEGEPAMILEENSKEGGVRLEAEIRDSRVDVPSLLCELVDGLLRGLDKGELAYAYQYALGRALGQLADSYDYKYVVVSGGAAVNSIIVKGIRDALKDKKVFLPRYSPPGDGGIAVGQAVVGSLSME